MNTNPTSTFHRTARLGVCFLIGAAALTACGEADNPVTAGPVSAQPSASVAKAYVSPEQADRAAILAVQAEKAAAKALSQRPAPKVAPEAYVSPEQADRAAMLAVRAEKAADKALERRAEQVSAEVVNRSHDVDLGTALARKAAAEKTSAHASADALERHAAAEKTSAHASADALEHWALSASES
jgi:hypothetical protein